MFDYLKQSPAGRGSDPRRSNAHTERCRLTLDEVLRVLGGDPVARQHTMPSYFPTRRVHAQQVLSKAGDRLESFHLVIAGSFKSTIRDTGGDEQVVAFPLAGDLIGFDAIGEGNHQTETTALEDSTVVALPRRQILALMHEHPEVEQVLMRAFSDELARRHRIMFAIGSLPASLRVARFLLEMSERMARFGYSPQRFRLRMSRGEIGSYLGLALETVSRTLTTLSERGLVRVNHREVTILDLDGLRRDDLPMMRRSRTAARRSAAAQAVAT
jgi:CRP/FNR family transcriptional regulator, anaerobic regulatory protein